MFHIRPATAADCHQLAAIERAAGELFPPGRIPDRQQTTSMEALTASLNANMLLVAAEEHESVGFAMSHAIENYLHLQELSEHPLHARQGIGRALVVQVQNLAKSFGLQGVSLTTFSDLPWNGPFYQSAGFSPSANPPPHITKALEEEQSLGMVARIGMLWETLRA